MNSRDENELSAVKKRILAKAKVQEEMDGVKNQIKELRIQQSQGKKVDQDIEACLGYLKVLKREKHSISEGNHTTFLDAKKLISPKLNYGSRKEILLAEIKNFAKEIRTTEKELAGGGYDSQQREDLNANLEKLRAKHRDMLLELKAIEQYNHTRFLEQKNLQQDSEPDPESTTGKKKFPFKPVAQPPTKVPEAKKTETDQSNDYNPPPMI